MKKIIKFFLGKKLGQSLFRFLFFLSLKGMNFGGGGNFKESGEEWVLKYFVKSAAPGRSLVFFDVGANLGEYAVLAAKILEQKKSTYQLHCFEPSKKTFDLLAKNTQFLSNINCYNFGLGSEVASQPLYSNETGSGLASLYERDLRHHNIALKEQETVAIDTLDNFCRVQGIGFIDFLKLDVEGHEFKVLDGAKNLLAVRKIKFIQFEFGGTDVDARVFFRDFFNLLSPTYNIYRILKNGLHPIKVYQEIEEIFITTNYLAILKR